MFTFETLFIILLIFMILLSLQKEEGPLLSFRNTANLRGIFALCIMTFHISKTSDLLYPFFAYLGLTLVGAFFFLSGYGLMKGYLYKKDYHKGYLAKRFVKLFLPYLFMTLVYFAYGNLNEDPHPVSDIFRSLYSSQSLVMYSWFIRDIMLHYLEFYLLMLLIKEKKERMYQSAILFFLFDFLVTLLGFNNSYIINGTFALGMIFAYREDSFTPFFRKHHLPIMMLSAVLAVLFRTPYLHFSRFFLIEKMILIFFILSLLSLCSFKNSFFSFFGKISLEIYMCHGLAKSIIRRFYGGPLFIQDLFIYILTILLSYLLYLLFDRISLLLLPPKKK